MKISEGIRLGSRGKRQIIGQWFDKTGGVCAIGALMMFLGVDKTLYSAFPNLENLLPNNKLLITEIKNRNDVGQTFEQIISWLESIGQ